MSASAGEAMIRSSKQRNTSFSIGIIIRLRISWSLKTRVAAQTRLSSDSTSASGAFFALPLRSRFPAIEAFAVLLAVESSIEQHVDVDVDGVTVIFLHARREAFRHDALHVMRGIDAEHVQQLGWAHRPAELFFHHFVDLAEIGAVA